jgi:hypothetical protein
VYEYINKEMLLAILAIPGFAETVNLPPKEFCEKPGLSKETERFLERVTKREAERENLLKHFSRN